MSLVALDRWSSYTVTIVWKFAWANSALVVLDKWSSYRGGCLNRFDCSCSNHLARPIFACFYKTQRLSCSICFSFLCRYLPFPAHLCKVVFDIPGAYLEPNHLFKMELFAKIVRGFRAIAIFAKTSILDVSLGS